MGPGANDDAAAAGAVALAHALGAVDDPRGREIRRGHVLDQLIDSDFRIAEKRETGGDDFRQVVRWDVGRHPDRDSRRAVDQQIGQSRRQYRRLALLAIVVGHEVDRFLVDVGQHLGGDLVQPALGVAIRRRRISVDRAEIALAVDERVAQRKVLHHPHQRFVGGRVAVRVVLPQHVADDPCALHVGAVPDRVRFVHGEEHAAMHRLQAVPDVRQGPANDHAHRVIEVGMPHFGFQAYRKGFFGELLHREKRSLPSEMMKSDVGPVALKPGYRSSSQPSLDRSAPARAENN